jgi:Protein of unknown function (DUF3631)
VTDALLDDVAATFDRYVVLPTPETRDAVVLWTVATHAQPALFTAPRLVISSPEKRCGKSRLLDVVEALCHSPLMAFNATSAALVRSIDADDPPTLLFDEADTIWPASGSGGAGAEALRALLNAGFNRGRPVIRCSGSGSAQTVIRLPSFAMAALAGIGDRVPDTITDRAVNIRMRRRAGHEHADPLRSGDLPALRELGQRLSGWLGNHLAELSTARPALPVTDRAADVWEPLVAVADLAGYSWGERARHACRVLCAAHSDAERDSGPGALLNAIRDTFGPASRVSTAELVSALSPLGITDASGLSAALRPYGIAPTTLRLPTGARLKGYRLDDFADTFARFGTDLNDEELAS